MRIPILYILLAIHVVNINPAISKVKDSPISQYGTPKGILIIMITGENKGIMESQNARFPSGSLKMAVKTIREKIRGIVTGSWNCWASASLSTADPIAANKDPYNR